MMKKTLAMILLFGLPMIYAVRTSQDLSSNSHFIVSSTAGAADLSSEPFMLAKKDNIKQAVDRYIKELQGD
ncbi:hypothetical protein PHSC3_000378 [Chlamydiales bacterium STE3]|nr:hypothetical protein PHSC3_000378 [Chlamydiales bacterium STE3]